MSVNRKEANWIETIPQIMKRKSTLERRRRSLSIEQLETRRVLATFLVTTNADEGAGSLRQAIFQANANPGQDRIEFAITGESKKIQLQSALPRVDEGVEIDGKTQAGYAHTPIVELDGSLLTTAGVNGLWVRADGTTIAGLSIYGFPASGIRIDGTSGATVQENFVGLAPSGEVPVANGFAGVLLLQSSGNLIGGPDKGNVIAGNGTEGVRIEGTEATNNRIQSNRIGTNQVGDLAIPNTLDGILVTAGANQNWIGTDGDGTRDSEEGNQISGNARFGIRVFGSNGNVFAGNLVGTNADGTGAIGNVDSGFEISNMSNGNLVGSNADGTSDTAERNIISGNGRDGIILRDVVEDNVVSGNYVGTSSDGLASIPNVLSGVSLFNQATDNLIGTQDGEYSGNLISGNAINGVWVGESHDNILAGNVIGLDRSGNAALQNGGRGILVVRGSTGNLIGTNDNGAFDNSERNLLSGNFHQGVAIGGVGTDNNVVAGNYIGTNVAGTESIPNTSSGVLISGEATGNVVGTTGNSRPQSSAGNLISGNDFWGIRFRNLATQNSAKGNLIGTDATGLSAVPNLEGGIGTFQAAVNNTIGGSTPIERNVISGNGGYGVDMLTDSGSNQVIGNWIGIAADGSSELGNTTGGILIFDASDNSIGDGTAEGSNSIAHNGLRGVAIEGNANSNRIARNSIFGHEVLGIDLGRDGRTGNDTRDLDNGPNGFQNTPELTFVASSSSSSQVQGVLNSEPNSAYQIDLYSSEGDLGRGEGFQFLTSLNVSTDSQGRSFWAASMPSTLGDNTVTAIAHGTDGSSEFSENVTTVPQIRVTTDSSEYSEDAGLIAVDFDRGEIPLHEEVRMSVQSTRSLQAEVTQSEVVIPAGVMSVQSQVNVIDDSIVESGQQVLIYAIRIGAGGAGSVEFAIGDNDQHAWSNLFQPEDVNGDRFVSSIDALLVINYLNANMQGSLDGPPLPFFFIDVNNDSVASSIDALNSDQLHKHGWLRRSRI